MAADEHHLASRLLHLVDDRYAHGVQPPDDLRVVRQLAEGNDGFSFLRGFDRPPDSELNDEQYLLRRTIIPAAHKLYLDCCFDALRQEQALWPDILDDLN